MGANAWVQAQRTGSSRWSVAAPRDTPGRASGVVRPVSQSKRVRKAEIAALHGGHPGGSASGKSPSTKGFPHGPVLRGRQSKDILFSMDHHRAADCNGGVHAGCVPGACRARACAVRARPPSETRRRVCHVSSGDQHRSSKMDSSVGEAVGGPWAWLWAWVRWVLCCAVRPLSRQGISTACPLGTDLGMKVDLPRPPRGAGQVGVVQGGSAGRGRLFRDARRCRLRLCTRGTTPCRCRALTCSGRGWVDTRA